MAFVVKTSGGGGLLSSEFACPTHGRFAATVPRSESDSTACPTCGAASPWSPSRAPLGRVKQGEVVRGKWEKPERKTWLDTRELGEGMDRQEWLDKRTAIREEQRWREVKEMKKS